MNRQAEVLIIDDEPEIRETLIDLISGSFSPLVASSGTEGLALAKKKNPTVILLDILMPGMDGVAVCKKLREDPVTSPIHIIMLSGANSPENRVRAFDSGADDFIAKPFDSVELISRIQSKVRRVQERKKHSRADEIGSFLSCGNLKLNLIRREAVLEGRSFTLSSLEFKLLQFILQNKDRVIPRQEILDAVWGDPKVPGRLIDAHVVSLRKKLNDFDHAITSVYGVGYAVRPIRPV